MSLDAGPRERGTLGPSHTAGKGTDDVIDLHRQQPSLRSAGRPPGAGDRPRPAYRHESRGIAYTLDPSASGGYLMTSTADDGAVEVIDVDHAARLIDEIEGVKGA
jgi:hypothetical protein